MLKLKKAASAAQKIKKTASAAIILKKLSGAQRRNRTTDTRIFSPLLYRLSYLGDKLYGGPSGARTPDLPVMSRLL